MIIESDKENLPEIIESMVEYGFADENSLCETLDIDDSELDALVSSSDHISVKQFNTYAKSLVAYLKRIRKNYERLYYAQKGLPKRL